MPSPTTRKPAAEWPGDAEMEIEMSDDDDFDFDDVEEEEENEEMIERRAESVGNVPVWRLIEMSREDRYLRRELADFEDYDSFDHYGDDYARLSH